MECSLVQFLSHFDPLNRIALNILTEERGREGERERERGRGRERGREGERERERERGERERGREGGREGEGEGEMTCCIHYFILSKTVSPQLSSHSVSR